MASRVALLFAVLVFTSALFAQDAKTIVSSTLNAMGGENMKSLQFTASGSSPGQLKDGNTPGPRNLIKSYVYTVDFTIPAAKLETGAIGGLPPQTMLGGEGHSLQFVNGEYAWDIGGVPGVIGGGNRPSDWPIIPFPATFHKGGDPMRQPNGDGLQSHSDVDRNEQIWLLPQGFLIGAMKNNATVADQTVDGQKYSVVTWTGPNGQKIIGYINDRTKMIDKVETWMDHPMYGDEHVIRTYDYYRDFGGGLQFPAHIVETLNTPALTGAKALNVELFVTEAKANVQADLSVPQAVKDTPVAPPFTIMTQKLGDGLYWLAGQNDCSLIVEFKDYVVVVEGPMNDDRSVAVIAETHKLIPNKPIRYMINTHPHVDHTGGVRGYAAIGATLITQQSNVEFIEELLKTPHTIIPDSLAKNPNARWKVEGVDDSRVITDGSRHLEIYHVRGNLHSSGMLMTYLPKEKILTEGDPWTPGMVNPKPGDRAYQRCCDAQNLYDNVMRLHLDVKTFAPIHGRIDTWEHFVQYLGLPPDTSAAKAAASGN